MLLDGKGALADCVRAGATEEGVIAGVVFSAIADVAGGSTMAVEMLAAGSSVDGVGACELAVVDLAFRTTRITATVTTASPTLPAR